MTMNPDDLRRRANSDVSETDSLVGENSNN